MPTKEQLFDMWEAELNFPSIRREDDPMYVPPSKLKDAHNCEDYEVMKQGDGSVYGYCSKCLKELY